MKKFGIHAASAAIAAVLLAGCSTTGETPEAEKTAAPVITAIGEEAIDDSVQLGRESGEILLKALSEKNFEIAKDLPVGSTRDTLTTEKFNALVQRVIDPNGGIASHAYLGDLARGNYRRMLWKVAFTTPQEKIVGFDMIFEVWVGRLDGELRIVYFGFHL